MHRQLNLNLRTDHLKEIFADLGSNLIVKDKNIDILIRNPFEYIQKAVAVLNDNKRLEPIDLPVISSQNAFLGAKNYNVGG